ncbi:probable glycerol-3-phosphate acyltransferase, mitochondrial isoform X1 [Chironomus tepperi]|uniref:probable glycerol-3-phosphate acyltransferase, mitochondrial isoform X1 n=1 Tax=Chironomus tepperi TaxID=113505 RepID=UPI00391F1F4A
MGKYEKPSIDMKIAAKMFDSAKLERMRCREIRKTDKERNLMTLKRTCLPVMEADYVRVKDPKCNRCNKDKENYGLTFEWHLEPVDILDDDKIFYGTNSTKRMLSKVTDGIIIEPAKIKMIKYLQENKSEIPIVYVFKSRDQKFDEILLNFCLKTYKLEIALSTIGMDEISLENHLNSHKSLMIFMDDEIQLKNVLKCIEYGKLKEIYLLPVSINYEIQHSKEFKPPMMNIFPKYFYENYGIVKVNFNEPYTCSDLLQWIKEDDETVEAMDEAIEGHLLHDIIFKRPIFATNILAYLMLTYFRTNGGTIEDIATRIDEIRNNPTNFIDFSFDGDAVDVAKYAVTKLNNKIIINENLMIKPKEDTATLIELWDYAETLICHFALQSVIILTAEHYKRVDSYVDYDKMIEHAKDLCEIIQLEVPLYKACSNLKEQLENAFDILSRKDLLTKPNVVTYTENEKRAQKIAEYFDDDDEYDEYGSYNGSAINAENEVTINTEKQTEINYLKHVILPIQESYMNVAYCLKRLIGDQIVDEQYFLNLTMNAMIDECFAENCKYWESCNTKWMKNALKLFELWGVVSKVTDADTVKYFISYDYNTEEGIHDLARSIERFSDY